MKIVLKLLSISLLVSVALAGQVETPFTCNTMVQVNKPINESLNPGKTIFFNKVFQEKNSGDSISGRVIVKKDYSVLVNPEEVNGSVALLQNLAANASDENSMKELMNFDGSVDVSITYNNKTHLLSMSQSQLKITSGQTAGGKPILKSSSYVKYTEIVDQIKAVQLYSTINEGENPVITRCQQIQKPQ